MGARTDLDIFSAPVTEEELRELEASSPEKVADKTGAPAPQDLAPATREELAEIGLTPIADETLPQDEPKGGVRSAFDTGAEVFRETIGDLPVVGRPATSLTRGLLGLTAEAPPIIGGLLAKAVPGQIGEELGNKLIETGISAGEAIREELPREARPLLMQESGEQAALIPGVIKGDIGLGQAVKELPGIFFDTLLENAVALAPAFKLGAAVGAPIAGALQKSGKFQTAFKQGAEKWADKQAKQSAKAALGTGATKEAVETAAQGAAARFMADPDKAIAAYAQQLGARVGGTQAIGLVEAAGMGAETYEATGDVNPITTFALGAVAGWIETWGGHLAAFERFLGPKQLAEARSLLKVASTTADAGVLKNIASKLGYFAREAFKASGSEGIQEFSQEFVAITNMQLQDPSFEMMTLDNALRLGESTLQGALIGIGGIAGDVYDAVMEGRKKNAENARQVEAGEAPDPAAAPLSDAQKQSIATHAMNRRNEILATPQLERSEADLAELEAINFSGGDPDILAGLYRNVAPVAPEVTPDEAVDVLDGTTGRDAEELKTLPDDATEAPVDTTLPIDVLEGEPVPPPAQQAAPPAEGPVGEVQPPPIAEGVPLADAVEAPAPPVEAPVAPEDDIQPPPIAEGVPLAEAVEAPIPPAEEAPQEPLSKVERFQTKEGEQFMAFDDNDSTIGAFDTQEEAEAAAQAFEGLKGSVDEVQARGGETFYIARDENGNYLGRSQDWNEATDILRVAEAEEISDEDIRNLAKEEINFIGEITPEDLQTLTPTLPGDQAGIQIRRRRRGLGRPRVAAPGTRFAGQEAVPTFEEFDKAGQEREIPTEGQAGAENYKVGKIKYRGMDLSIENVPGDERFPGVPMTHHYGRIKRTEGKDGDHVDFFMGESPESGQVFVVDQRGEEGGFDEHKVMMGFNSIEEAEQGYLSNYEEGWDGLGAITPMTYEEFNGWLEEGDQTKPVGEFAEGPALPVEKRRERGIRETAPGAGKAPERLPKSEAGPPTLPEEAVETAEETTPGTERKRKRGIRGETPGGRRAPEGIPQAETAPAEEARPTIDEEIAALSDEGIDALLDEGEAAAKGEAPAEEAAPAEEEKPYGPKKRKQPTPTPRERKKKTATDAIKKAGELGVGGIEDIAKGLSELFGGPGGLGVGPIKALNRETYEAAKPHFEAGLNKFREAGKTIAEYVKWVFENFGENVKPYLRAFIKEQQGETPVFEDEVDPTEETAEETAEEVEEEAEPEVEAPVAEEEVEEVAEPTTPTPPTPTAPTVEGESAEETEGETVEEETEEAAEEETPAEDTAESDTIQDQDTNVVVESTGTTFDPYKRKLDRETEEGETTANVKKILKTVDRSKVFSFYGMPKEATPGTERFLAQFRNITETFISVYAKKQGWRRWSYKKYLDYIIEVAEANPEILEEMKIEAAKYQHTVAQIMAEVKQSKSVTDARSRLMGLFFDSFDVTSSFYTGTRVSFTKSDFLESEDVSKYINLGKLKDLLATGFEDFTSNEDTETYKINWERQENPAYVREGRPDVREGKQVGNSKEDPVLQETFGLRGMAFGDWVSDTESLNAANMLYEALADLADHVGIPREAIGFFKALEMQFGNLGTRNSRAAAFFIPKGHTAGTTTAGELVESEGNIINMTKTKGDGSLSHEWFHALDDNTADHRTRLAIDDLKEAFQYHLDFSNGEALVKEVLDDDSFWHRSHVYKGKKGLELVRAIVEEKYENRVHVRSEYLRNASKMPNAKYQTDIDEMWARALESWLYDTLDGTNNFLVGEWASEKFVSEENGFAATPYPFGEERLLFNELIQEFIDNIVFTEDGISLKEDYELASTKKKRRIQDEKEALLGRLEEIWNQHYKVDKSEDGLYWYAYKLTKRGISAQPKGYAAYDDAYTLEDNEDGGIGAVGYIEPVNPDSAMDFDLQPIIHDKTDATTYIEGRGEGYGTPDDHWADGESTLEDESPPDVETPPREGTPEAGPGVGAGSGVDGISGTVAGGGAIEGGEGTLTGQVDTPSTGELTEETDTGPDAVPPAVDPTLSNYFIKDYLSTGKKSLNDRFHDNIAAIRILKDLEESGRHPTEQEKDALAKYSGWGGMGEAFATIPSEGWLKKATLINRFMTEEEKRDARASSTTSYYTPPSIYNSMWKILKHLGFTGGRVLSPSSGIGHELGTMPLDLRPTSSITAVEIDNLSNRIGKLLYPKANWHFSGYEDAVMPRNFFDVVITNVPFSTVAPADAEFNREKFQIHDYFFRKALAQTRRGGVVAMITSSRTMDNPKGTIRRVLNREGAELIGAVRLPSGTFSKTDVVADIIFIRKKGFSEMPSAAWAESNDTMVPLKFNEVDSSDRVGVPMNEYWGRFPEHILGNPYAKHGRFGGLELGVLEKDDSQDIETKIEQVMDDFPSEVMENDKGPEDATLDDLVPAPQESPEHQYYERDGVLYMKDAGLEYAFKGTKKNEDIIRRSMKMRDKLRELNRAMLADAPDDVFLPLQKELNDLYDSYVKKYGSIDKSVTDKNFGWDLDSAAVYSLEKIDNKDVAHKADIFSKRTLPPYKIPEKADSPQDALAFSLGFKGRVDFDYMRELTGADNKTLLEQLQGYIYKDPEDHNYVPADEYLSGNVVKKLEIAKAAAKADPTFTPNIEALESVQPRPLTMAEIKPRLGSAWVPADVVRRFVKEYVNDHDAFYDVYVNHSPELGTWYMSYDVNYGRFGDNKQSLNKAKAYVKEHSQIAGSELGTRYASFYDILERLLNGKKIEVNFTDPFTGKRYSDPVQTDLAQQKAEAIHQAFHSWTKSQADVSERLEGIYNRLYNTNVLRKYDGSHLQFPGKNPLINLYETQKRAVWRWITSGNTYLAHEVGTGKTWGMVATAMEAKRLGLRRRPMVVAFNESTIRQFEREFLELYPTAKVLTLYVGTKKDSIRKAVASINTAQYDVILMHQKSFERIKLNPDTESGYLQEEIDEARQVIESAKNERKDSRFVADLEKQLGKLEGRLKRLTKESDKKSLKGLTWDDLGVDFLIVDEAHSYKNVPFFTNRGDVRGVDSKGSGRGFDFYLKTRFMNDRYPGGLMLASGTPLTNSVGELFTIQRFLQPDALKERGLHNFDAWASTFGEIAAVPEYDPKGGGGIKYVQKFHKFVNVPELVTMAWSVMDVARADDVGIKRPRLYGGKPIDEIVPQSPMLKQYQDIIVQRAKEIETNPYNHKTGEGATYGTYPDDHKDPEKRGKPIPDNILRLISDGKKAAIDMRLINPNLEQEEDSKITRVVRNIVKRYHEPPDYSRPGAAMLARIRKYGPRAFREQARPSDPSYSKPYRGVQLVFSDLGTPTGAIRKQNFSDKEWDDLSEEEKRVYTNNLYAESDTSFNVYDGIRDALVKEGIPKEEIAFIHEATNAKKLKGLYRDVKSGRVRVLIGSTEKMGTGVNVQDMLIAAHHMDQKWNAAGYNQRNGRIWRQGNTFKEIYIHNYVTEKTVDSFVWDKVAGKGKIIDNFMAGNLSVREMEDISEETMNIQQVAAQASGDESLLKMLELERQEASLRAMEAEWLERRRRANFDSIQIPREIEREEKTISDIEKVKARAEEVNAIKFHGDDTVYVFKRHSKKINEKLKGIHGGLDFKGLSQKGYKERRVPIGVFGVAEDVEVEVDGKKKKDTVFTDKNYGISLVVSINDGEHGVTDIEVDGIGHLTSTSNYTKGEYEWQSSGDVNQGQKPVFKGLKYVGSPARAVARIASSRDLELDAAVERKKNLVRREASLQKIIDTEFEKAEELAEVQEELAALIETRTQGMGGLTDARKGAKMDNYKHTRYWSDDENYFSWSRVSTNSGNVHINSLGANYDNSNATLAFSSDVNLFDYRENRRTRSLKFSRHNTYYSGTPNVVKALNEADPSRNKTTIKPSAFWETQSGDTVLFFTEELAASKQDVDFVLFTTPDAEFRYLSTAYGHFAIATTPVENKETGEIEDRAVAAIQLRKPSAVADLQDGERIPPGIEEIYKRIKKGEENPRDINTNPGGATVSFMGTGVAYELLVKDLKYAKNATQKLIEIGTRVIRDGYNKLQTFRARMKEILGDLWNKFKGQMVKVYSKSRKIVGNERGAVEIGGPELNDNRSDSEDGSHIPQDRRVYDNEPADAAEVEKAKVEAATRTEDESKPEAKWEFIGASMDRPSEPHPLTAPDVEGNPFVDAITRKMRKGKDRDFLDKMLADIPDDDLKTWKEMFGLPYWIAKEHPEFRRLMDIENRRDEERSKLHINLMQTPVHIREGEVHAMMKLKLEDAEAVGKYIVQSDKNQKTYKKEDLRKGVDGLTPLNDEQVAAYYEWKRSMENAWEVKFAYAEAMLYVPYAHHSWMKFSERTGRGGKPVVGPLAGLPISDLQKVAEGKMTLKAAHEAIGNKTGIKAFDSALKRVKAPASTLKEYRARWGKVKFYFPRVREYGKIVVQAWQGEGESRRAVASKMFNSRRQAKQYASELAKKYGKESVRIKPRPKTPESLYGDVNDTAIERFINISIDKMQQGQKINEEEAEGLRDAVFETIAEELNVRGFLQRGQKRRDGEAIEGYQEDNVQEIFSGYMSSLAGFVTKQKAAYEFYRALSDIGVEIGERDAQGGKKEKFRYLQRPQLFEYSRRYVHDMLLNADTLDQHSARLRSFAFFMYLAGNMKSAVVNLTQNFVLGIPILGRYTKGSGNKYLKAMNDVARRNTSEEEKAAIKEAIDRGVATDQQLREFTGRMATGLGRRWEDFVKILGTPFSMAEIYNRKSAFLAMYRVQREQGASQAEAFEVAKEYVYEVHFLYGKANLPQAARGSGVLPKGVRTAYTFRTFNHNFLLAQRHFMKVAAKEGHKISLDVLGKSLAALVLLGGISSIPFADDLLELMEKMFKTPIRAKMAAHLAKISPMLDRFGLAGLPGIFGFDLSGSLRLGLPRNPFAGGLDDTVFGVYGGLVSRMSDAMTAMGRRDYLRAFEYASPMFAGNVARAVREYNKGVTQPSGKLVYDKDGKPLRLTAGEAIGRAAGFRPARDASVKKEQRSFYAVKREFDNTRADLYARMRLATSKAERDAVRKEMQKYNRSVLKFRGAIPKITSDSIKRAMKQKPNTYLERFRNSLQ